MRGLATTCAGAGVQAGQQAAGTLAGVVFEQLQVCERWTVQAKRSRIQLGGRMRYGYVQDRKGGLALVYNATMC
jgi:hypothetical protein